MRLTEEVHKGMEVCTGSAVGTTYRIQYIVSRKKEWLVDWHGNMARKVWLVGDSAKTLHSHNNVILDSSVTDVH